MITVKRITEETKQDILLPNEPFSLWGKMIPLYDGTTWSYRTKTFPDEEVSEMVFPDEDYDFKELKKDHFFVGAYNDDGTCIGLAIYCKDWFRYLYLDDLKVSKQYRSQGVGRLLLEEGKKIASENGYRGIYTIGQDNNLSACQFYLHNHFEIGGFNTNVYRGTSQENKNDIYFYLDC